MPRDGLYSALFDETHGKPGTYTFEVQVESDGVSVAYPENGERLLPGESFVLDPSRSSGVSLRWHSLSARSGLKRAGTSKAGEPEKHQLVGAEGMILHNATSHIRMSGMMGEVPTIRENVFGLAKSLNEQPVIFCYS